ncbi:hypothetical protein K474DRAFT_174486 [Panus rudis PR-1116 ss-1]|nr:hypothetical protein K474DRAFT_174486 [Panus rudis PR-1116 ss-1]
MQSPSQNPVHRISDPLASQPLSLQQSLSQSPASHLVSRQQLTSSLSRETTPMSAHSSSTSQSTNTASSPVSHLMQSTPPLTPPSSLSPASSASVASMTSTVSIGSTLSASAPQFKTRLLDPPIDIHSLTLSDSTDSLCQSPSASGTLAGSVSHSADDVLDISLGGALLNEGPTPTQETFALQQTSIMSPASPYGAAPLRVRVDEREPMHATAGSVTSSEAEDMRTPNVYINGLPPNFPEEQLLAMTSEFGEVISVRTFTRHVSDKPSGYGFVLFGSVDAAEQCIETLRKYRNLHPSFSKRIHKIPGTSYGALSPSDSEGSVSAYDSDLTASDSFKARMERLHDRASTNLYMEGLPLDINEATLGALINPYKIMSSRFFHTRLSNPPRIIAFVRLESRRAAEEIIERLHGRMIRGWNDPGCRISVRFADNNDQRELRRSERMNREGENSPARLTIAQAALLNLKGTQLQSGTSPIATPQFGLSPVLNTSMPLPSDQIAYTHSPTFIPGQSYNSVRGAGHLPVLSIGTQHGDLHAQSAALNNLGPNLRIPQDGLSGLPESNFASQLQLLARTAGAATRAQNGYTAMEQLILQAHNQSQQVQDVHLMSAAAGVDAARRRTTLGLGSESLTDVSSLGQGNRLSGALPSMSEEEFHASAAYRQPSLLRDSISHSDLRIPPSRLALDHADAKANFTRQRNQTHTAEARASAAPQRNQGQTTHTRSTTMPSQYTSVDRSAHLGILSARTGNNFPLDGGRSSSNGTRISNATQGTALDSKNSHILYSSNNVTFSKNSKNSNDDTSNTDSTQRNNNISSAANSTISQPQSSFSNNARLKGPDTQNRTLSMINPHRRIGTSSSTRSLTLKSTAARTSPSIAQEHDGNESGGSQLSSPALTHSTRTPSTLSPSTPFSAFADTFDGNSPNVGVAVSSVAIGGGAGDIGLGMGTIGVNVGGGATAVKEKANAL